MKKSGEKTYKIFFFHSSNGPSNFDDQQHFLYLIYLYSQPYEQKEKKVNRKAHTCAHTHTLGGKRLARGRRKKQKGEERGGK